MKRQLYFSVVEEKLNTLAVRINSRGKLNILDLHNHSESFYQYFLNELYDWKLTNENENKVNVEAIDLIDPKNRLVVQVSATSTKQKIESSLSKELIKKYKDYTFKFISIANDSDSLMDKTFANPHGINFNPVNDIIDKNTILKKIKGLDIDSSERIYRFICRELGGDVDFMKLETNLASVINILSKEDWDKKSSHSEIRSFEIERKISFNNLNSSKGIINDYLMHHGRVDKIYSEFDTLGINKSSTVLSTIRQEYLKAKGILSDDSLFFQVIENVQTKVVNSTNYVSIPLDELELCINILIVDAFIRCKIFENPENYNYATT